MDYTALCKWLDAYGEAWEGQNPKAAAALFTEGGSYAWGPFGAPIVGRDAIQRAWEVATRGNQADINFGHEPLAVTEDGRGIARWWASMKSAQTGDAVRMEGIFLVTLNEVGLCSEFREWWNEDPPASGASDFN